jgi:hypothetical protein
LRQAAVCCQCINESLALRQTESVDVADRVGSERSVCATRGRLKVGDLQRRCCEESILDICHIPLEDGNGVSGTGDALLFDFEYYRSDNGIIRNNASVEG